MKNVLVFGRIKKHVNLVKKYCASLGFKNVKASPDFVISLGGDGTYLLSERLHPGIPKLLIRDKSVCFECKDHDLETFKALVSKVLSGDFKVVERGKLECFLNGKKFNTAVNDFILRNKNPTTAIRFFLKVNKKRENALFIGDGVVVSSKTGGTAYYRAITGKEVRKEYGLAFNNVVSWDDFIDPERVFKKLKHNGKTLKNKALELSKDFEVEVKLLREKALLAFDNSSSIKTINPGDIVTFKPGREKARIIEV